jgi:hypothetical protein
MDHGQSDLMQVLQYWHAEGAADAAAAAPEHDDERH